MANTTLTDEALAAEFTELEKKAGLPNAADTFAKDPDFTKKMEAATADTPAAPAPVQPAFNPLGFGSFSGTNTTHNFGAFAPVTASVPTLTAEEIEKQRSQALARDIIKTHQTQGSDAADDLAIKSLSTEQKQAASLNNDFRSVLKNDHGFGLFSSMALAALTKDDPQLRDDILNSLKGPQQKIGTPAQAAEQQPVQEAKQPIVFGGAPRTTALGQAVNSETGRSTIFHRHAEQDKATAIRIQENIKALQVKIDGIHERQAVVSKGLEESRGFTNLWRGDKGLRQEASLLAKLEPLQEKNAEALESQLKKVQKSFISNVRRADLADSFLTKKDEVVQATGDKLHKAGDNVKSVASDLRAALQNIREGKNPDATPIQNAAHAFLGQGANGDHDLQASSKQAPEKAVAPIQNAAHAFLGQGANQNQDIAYNKPRPAEKEATPIKNAANAMLGLGANGNLDFKFKVDNVSAKDAAPAPSSTPAKLNLAPASRGV